MVSFILSVMRQSLTRDHEPASDPRHTPRNGRRCKYSHPRVLPSSNWVGRADLRHRVGNGERKYADSNPGVDHDKGSARHDTDDQDSAQRRPACHDAEAKSNHTKQAKRSFQLLLIPQLLKNGNLSDIIFKDFLFHGHIAGFAGQAVSAARSRSEISVSRKVFIRFTTKHVHASGNLASLYSRTPHRHWAIFFERKRRITLLWQ